MSGSTLSRRTSEFFGVALFAVGLIWLIALATYEPTDPTWFFSARPDVAPANFVGRVGAFIAELSFQLVGYASYLIPAMLAVIGWHYFWCRALDAAYTKLIGAGLLLACFGALLSLAFGTVDISGKAFRTGGYAGEWLAELLAGYLNRTGSIIVILTLLFLSSILSTQVSLGRIFSLLTAVAGDGLARLTGAFRAWRATRRCSRQRRDIAAKYTRPVASPPRQRDNVGPSAPAAEPAVARTGVEAEPLVDERRPLVGRRARLEQTNLPLPEPEPIQRAARSRVGTLPPLSLLDPPRPEGKIDERAHGRSAPPRGEMP